MIKHLAYFTIGLLVAAGVSLSSDQFGKKSPPLGDEASLYEELKTVSAAEKPSRKGTEIAKVGPVARTAKSRYDIQIVSTTAIEGGVEVLARAWENGEQIGFGKDGTVDIERFRIFNPPILVADPSGPIERVLIDVDGTEKTILLREDPKEALLQVIENTIAVKKQKYGSRNIVQGRVGNTTSTFYSSAGDGYVEKTVAAFDWDATHDAATGDTVTDTAGFSSASAAHTGGGSANIKRSFIPFDTSGLSDTDGIDSATLSLFGSGKVNADDDGDDWLNVVQTTQANPAALATADFDQAGSINNPTEGSTRIDITAYSTTGYNDWVLNATGLGWIVATGNTLFGLREGHDAIDSPISGGAGKESRGTFLPSEDGGAGTTQDPKLVVEHSEICDPEVTPCTEAFATAGYSEWTAPEDVTANISCWGGGGGGRDDVGDNAGGGGGGGGAFASSTTSVLSGAVIRFFVGAGGGENASGATSTASTTAPATVVAASPGYTPTADLSAGVGGLTTTSTGTTENNGGNGGIGTNSGDTSGGGGGAGGRHGAGVVGVDGNGTIGGDGGAGDNGSGGAGGPDNAGAAGSNGTANDLGGGGGGGGDDGTGGGNGGAPGAGGGGGEICTDGTQCLGAVGRCEITYYVAAGGGASTPKEEYTIIF